MLTALFAWGGNVSALGLGELHTRSFLGEPFSAELEVLTAGKEVVDAGCFHLRSPQGDGDLPWLRRGAFNLRRGPKLMLEIRSEVPLRDPVLQVGITVGCGHEVQRDYTLFLSPRGKDVEPPAQTAVPPTVAQPQVPMLATRRQPIPQAASEPPPPPKLTPRRMERHTKPVALPDRLVLSSGEDTVGEPSLRLATELIARKEEGRAAGEAQREILRLEYRMLAAMNEQATTQLAAAEKLRNMETTLADLQQRAGEFAGRIEKGVAPAGRVADSEPSAPAAQAVPASSPAVETRTSPAALPSDKPRSEAAPPRQTLISEWSFYGAMLGAVLGVGGWLGWRQYRERRMRLVESAEPMPEPVVVPPKSAEFDDLNEVDFHVEPAADASTLVDVPLEADDAAPPVLVEGADAVAEPVVQETQLSVSGASVDEHFEVNPVMELAEIMLSFGRVKGAAQALQEYIDHNPEEALQPWIRLMDVYRMAEMREEFDRLAHDLNRHFNVEVQHWSEEGASNPKLDEPLDFVLDAEEDMAPPLQIPSPKALTLEDIEHISTKLVECWGSADCLGYLNQLLRDNRGGQRSGFTLPVVEEILFLIELLETRNSMESKNGGKNE